MSLDHSTIDEEALVARYLQGALAADEETRFEEHFLGCAACQAELVAERGLRRGLKRMAVEDLATLRVGVLAALARWRWSRLALGGLAALALAALPAGLLWRESRQLRDRAAAAETEAGALRERLAAGERLAAESRRDLEAQLAAATAAAGKLVAPRVDLPVFLLRTFRDPAEAPPVIDLARVGDAVALAVDVGLAAAPRYRAVLRGPDGSSLFERVDLQPNALEVLLLTFPASFLPSGELGLEVDGLRSDGTRFAVGRFRFRVVGAAS